MNRSLRSVALAVLVVLSALPAGTFLGLAQTSGNAYTYTYDGAPKQYVIDRANVNGSFTVELVVNGSQIPDWKDGSNHTLLRKTVSSNSERYVTIWNHGAYETGTVRVELDANASGEPKFATGKEVDFAVMTQVGHTGGDPDMKCGLQDKIGDVAAPGVRIIDCTANPGSTSATTEDIEGNQTALDVYQSGTNMDAANQNFEATMDNYLQDTKTQALLIGKRVYIRELNNGSGNATAVAEAKRAVQDYYAKHQIAILNQWNQTLRNAKYDNQTATVETTDAVVDSTLSETETLSKSDYFRVFNSKMKNDNMTLVNGTDKNFLYFLAYDESITSNRRVYPDPHATDWDFPGYIGYNHTTAGVDRVNTLNATWYRDRLGDIGNQSADVEQQLETLANNTYDEYQQGDINNSDLVDPYLLADNFSAGSEFQSWAAAQMTMLGVNSPDAFDQTGYMNVTVGNQSYKGIVMSPENPQRGQFEVNQTYDPANISGTQYIVTSDRVRELKQPFTLKEIRTHSGKQVKNVTIEKTEYRTANVTELQNLYDQLNEKYAELEARQENLNDGAGGGFLGGSKVSPVIALGAVALLLLIGLSN